MKQKKALIIGAGPGGLTAAYELLEKSDIVPHVFEMSNEIGGISRTINYKGNRMDIGGHRFFSKSDRVMEWWKNIMPLQGSPSYDDLQLKREIPLSKDKNAPNPEKTNLVMLARNRLSRIYFLRRFFDYPISLSVKTLKSLGVIRVIKIGFSYVKTSVLPKRKEKNLEDFFINRFGKELYRTFFKDYTEKVWGVPCSEIDPKWGAQRIKGLSILEALKHAVLKPFQKKQKDLSQKSVETSLIDKFMYPKLGPGQLWEETAKIIQTKGGIISMQEDVIELIVNNDKIVGIKTENQQSGKITEHHGDYVISTMPIKELIQKLNTDVPEEVMDTAKGLQYRDFITVGVLTKKLKINNETKLPSFKHRLLDNWIYIQERDVKIGRLQIFNNWSPYMVKDYQNTMWLGLEYFANEGDELWTMNETDFLTFAIDELVKIDILDKNDVLDGTVVKVKKAYPSYFGTYSKFHLITEYLEKFTNLYPIGRNGMHRYNNQDHSMLTAMTAVENILSGKNDKSNIWKVNTEKTYHEKK